MAIPNQLRFGSVEICHDQVLGVGSYGKVCKAKYGQLPCAAKLLHDTMFEGVTLEYTSLLRDLSKNASF